MKQWTMGRSALGIAVTALFAALPLGACSGAPSNDDGVVSGSAEALRGARVCAGRRGRTCPDGQYCNALREGICPGRRHIGVCAAEPEICTDIFQPVCGCDGNTYPNSCNAAAAGVAVLHDGACATVRQTCGGIAAIPCPGGGRCVDDPTDSCDPSDGGADCGGICTCVETVLCVRGSHFDGSPAVCACVPDSE
jgi:hypothetical protein